MKIEKSPCLGCTKTKRPDVCERKNCAEWQGWFCRAWDRTAEMLSPDVEERRIRSVMEEKGD